MSQAVSKTHASLTGTLLIERLYLRSKSEGSYPVLVTEAGRRYRVFVFGSNVSAELLKPYEKRVVTIIGLVDNLRGHWRIGTELKNVVVLKDELAQEVSETGVVNNVRDLPDGI